MSSQQDTSSPLKSTLTIGAMALVEKVAGEYHEVQSGYTKGLWRCLARILVIYKKILKDPEAQKELFCHKNVTGLPQKPPLSKTSRLLLYVIANVTDSDERTEAGKYARVVDYLYEKRLGGGPAVIAFLKSAGGVKGILKEIRKRKVLKAADQPGRDDVQESDQEDEPGEAPSGALTLGDLTEIFDPETDVSIHIGREPLAQVWELPDHECFYLKCKKKDPVGRDWIQIVGILVDPPPSE